MPASPQTKQSPVVFISYAHESDALRGSVKEFADWLGARGCTMLTDHRYGYRAPPEGWQAWMLGCINKADVVLVVCSPRLKARYEKTESPDVRFGGAYEGAIVTQHIYDAQMRNTKFYPVLPDGGNENDIPTTLKSWWSGHRFPSGYEGILCMIFDEPPGVAPVGGSAGHRRGSAESTPTTFGPHERVTIDKLEAAEAHLFLSALREGFPKRFPNAAVPGSATEMVQWFSSRGDADVQKLFYLVRRALEAQKTKTGQKSQIRAGEEAAALLYCIAACRAVDTAVARENALQNGGYVLFVPHSENIICAVIATALFGGSLHLKPPDPSDLVRMPRPEWVLDVPVSPNGDWTTPSFECAAFAAVFRNSRELSDLCLDSNGLTPQQHARLAARIDDIKDRELSLALVVHGVTQSEAVSGLSNDLKLPVLLPSTEITTKLLGMDANRLMAEIVEFWRLVEESNDTTSASNAPPSTSGAPTMSKPDIKIEVHGGTPQFTLATGDHSAAQTGSNNVANVGHREETDLSALTPLLQELLAAIVDLPSAKARETLTPHVQVAQAEVVKKEKPEPGRIKQALDSIKPAAEVLEGGEKIVTLCNKAYQLLAPFLGLPILPLP